MNTAAHPDAAALIALADSGQWSAVADRVATGATADDAVDATNQHGASLLWLAARHGREELVEPLLRAGADVHRCDDHGMSPLHVAATAAIATSLVEHGVRVDTQDYLKRSPLWLAVRNGRERVVDVILQAGADVNQVDHEGNAPLSIASSAAIASKLIARGARVDAVNRSLQSALWLAAKRACEPVVRVLLQAGADANRADPEAVAPLSVAATKAIATALIERGARVDAVNVRGESALWRAAHDDLADIADALVDAGASNAPALNGPTPLVLAAEAGRWSVVASLLRSPRLENVDFAGGDGRTALWRAVMSAQDDIVAALLRAGATNKADTAVRIRLLHDSAAINRPVLVGTTPLMLAARTGRWSIVTLLARSPRLDDVDEVDGDGKTALRLAVECINESRQAAVRSNARTAAAALLCAGADVDGLQSGFMLQRTAEWGHAATTTMLLAAGAQLGAPAMQVCSRPEVVALLLAAEVTRADAELSYIERREYWPRRRISVPVDEQFTTDEQARLVAKLSQALTLVPDAKKRIEHVGFAIIRARVHEICCALQPLDLPAPQLIEIVTASCEPFAPRLPYHYLWDAVVLIKHFHNRVLS